MTTIEKIGFPFRVLLLTMGSPIVILLISMAIIFNLGRTGLLQDIKYFAMHGFAPEHELKPNLGPIA